MKKIVYCAIIGGDTIFPLSPRTTGTKKMLSCVKKNFFSFSFMNPLYVPILVFPKFDPLTASGMALF